MEPIIIVKGLTKHYGQVEAVKGIDFTVEKGQLFAFLGPNGAGKSTTINMICTFLTPNAGEVSVNGYVLGTQDDAIRQRIGIVFQDSVLDSLLTVKENLMTRGSFYHLTKSELEVAIEQAMKVTDVTSLADRRYGTLSGGQRRRVDIARSLIHHPNILFLDEPTTGLDPQTRKNVWQTIRNLQKEHGMTVFLTTHYMEEAAAADAVVVIDNGEIVAIGTPSELKEKYSNDTLQLRPSEREKVKTFLEINQIPYGEQADLITVPLQSTLSALPLLKQLEPFLESFQVLNGTMDDAFVTITGKEMREE